MTGLAGLIVSAAALVPPSDAPCLRADFTGLVGCLEAHFVYAPSEAHAEDSRFLLETLLTTSLELDKRYAITVFESLRFGVPLLAIEGRAVRVRYCYQCRRDPAAFGGPLR